MLNTAHSTPQLAQSLFLRRCQTPASCGTRPQRRGQHAGPASSTTMSGPVASAPMSCPSCLAMRQQALPAAVANGDERAHQQNRTGLPSSSSQSGPLVTCVYYFYHNLKFPLLRTRHALGFGALFHRRRTPRAGFAGVQARAPPGRRRRATAHAPTAFILERTQSPVSSSWDTSDSTYDSTEPKPRLRAPIDRAPTSVNNYSKQLP